MQQTDFAQTQRIVFGLSETLPDGASYFQDSILSFPSNRQEDESMDISVQPLGTAELSDSTIEGDSIIAEMADDSEWEDEEHSEGSYSFDDSHIGLMESSRIEENCELYNL